MKIKIKTNPLESSIIKQKHTQQYLQYWLKVSVVYSSLLDVVCSSKVLIRDLSCINIHLEVIEIQKKPQKTTKQTNKNNPKNIPTISFN